MAHLGNTIVNGALRVIGGENVDTINGVTVGTSPKFTDASVTQTATTTDANYEVLFSVTADNTTRTEGTGKTTTLRFNPNKGALMEGSSTVASGTNTHAEGSNTTASGNHSHTEGYYTLASKFGAHAEGNWTVASGIEAHAEGSETTASGDYSHAEGYQALANVAFSHAEGRASNASGSVSHAEGFKTTASGNGAHAEGGYTTDTTGGGTLASGENSHTEGCLTTASGDYGSHAEGYKTSASGISAHAEGQDTCASGKRSHAEGISTSASGSASHAEGNATSASGNNGSHAEGFTTVASGTSSHAEGQSTKATNSYSHAEGFMTCASNSSSHAEGNTTRASGNCSHAEGQATSASGNRAHAEGSNTSASGNSAHAEGTGTIASGNYSHAAGEGTSAGGACQTVIGKYNVADDTSLFIIGNGTANNARSNALNIGADAIIYPKNGIQYPETAGPTLPNNWISCGGGYSTNTGKSGLKLLTCEQGDCVSGLGQDCGGGPYELSIITGASAGDVTYVRFLKHTVAAPATYTTLATLDTNGDWYCRRVVPSGSDYAEYFEWADGNPNNEDRVGYFVAFDNEDKIKKASPNDEYILGVTSSNPSILGNSDTIDANSMYLKDDFGRTIYELQPEMEFVDGGSMIPKMDKDGNIHYIELPKSNPNYDPDVKPKHRSELPEWSPIGMLGILTVRDDGNCQVNRYCTVGENGIAVTATSSSINKYRVIKRRTNNIIDIIFR